MLPLEEGGGDSLRSSLWFMNCNIEYLVEEGLMKL